MKNCSEDFSSTNYKLRLIIVSVKSKYLKIYVGMKGVLVRDQENSRFYYD